MDLATDLAIDPIGGWFGAVVTRTSEEVATVTIPAAEEADPSGFARLVMATDMAGGICAYFTGAPAAVTADLELHRFGAAARGAITATGTVLRRSRRQVLVAVDLRDEDGDSIASATVNSAVLLRPSGLYVQALAVGQSVDLTAWRAAPPGTVREVFLDEAGDLPLGKYSANPQGRAHGALIAAIVEPALAAHGLREVHDLLVRYLAPARVGPVRVRLGVARRRGHSLFVAADLIDAGTDELVALATASGPYREES